MSTGPVLIVEDDEDLRASVAALLELEGYRVLGAANGKEALALACGSGLTERPRCILLDLMMPVMDGRAFLRALANECPDALATTRIFIWTGKGSAPQEPLDFPRPLETFSKSADVSELLAAVERNCGAPH